MTPHEITVSIGGRPESLTPVIASTDIVLISLLRAHDDLFKIIAYQNL